MALSLTVWAVGLQAMEGSGRFDDMNSGTALGITPLLAAEDLLKACEHLHSGFIDGNFHKVCFLFCYLHDEERNAGYLPEELRNTITKTAD